MKKVFYLLFFIIGSGVAAPTQTAAQTPAPAASPSPAAIEDDRDVVKITTNLIQIDVTVTDGKGRIITDLKPEEIEIYENNQKQDITNFSFINNVDKTLEKRPAKDPEKDKSMAPAPPVPLGPDQVKRTIALVVDDLSLSFESAYYTRRALRKYVDEQMQPNDLVAIIRTGSGIGALQQFTSDKRMLYAAIERLKWNPAGKNNYGAFSARGGDSDAPAVQAETDMQEFQDDLFAVGTLGAVNYVVRGMRTLPGRKSIILFSEGFSLNSKNGDSYRVRNALRLLSDLANRASVVIYTIDSRGLQVLGFSAADRSPGSSSMSEGPMANLLETQYGLSYLAKVTGGIAIKNNNDLNQGIQKILEDQNGYYLIGYQPDEKTFDAVKARFNDLMVKVTRPGLKVRYRSGFFGVTDENAKPAVAKTPQQQIINALSSPFTTGDITVKLTPRFTNDLKKGSFVSSLIHVEASDLKFTDEPDGWKKAVFDIVAVVFGENGLLVDHLSRTETLRVKGDMYRKVMEKGFVYNVPFPIKKAGAYQLRIAVRDAETTKIGSANQFVEVPDLNKKRLILSGLIFQNLKQDASKTGEESEMDTAFLHAQDTALRQFQAGSALFYNSMIYNPKIDKSTGQPKLTTQVKLFQNGKEIFTGKETDYVPDKGLVNRLPMRGAIQLGTVMQPGEYVLQLVVTDLLGKEKTRTRSEWLDFEIVK